MIFSYSECRDRIERIQGGAYIFMRWWLMGVIFINGWCYAAKNHVFCMWAYLYAFNSPAYPSLNQLFDRIFLMHLICLFFYQLSFVSNNYPSAASLIFSSLPDSGLEDCLLVDTSVSKTRLNWISTSLFIDVEFASL